MLSGDDLVMGRLMERLASRADRTALLVGGRHVSYGELAARSDRLANALGELGIRKGERVAFAYPNGDEIVVCYLACAKSGVVGVPLARRLTEEEAEFELRDSGAVAVICPGEWADYMLGGRDRLPGLRHVIRDGGDAADDVDLAALLAAASPEPPAVELAPEDPFCVMYTGGTTGTAKAAVQTQASWAACVDTVVDVWAITPEDRHVIVLPMTHVAWFTCAAYLHAGGRVTVLPQWDPAAVLRTVAEQQITTLNMIPTMLGDLLTAVERAGETDLSSLRLLTVAGSSMPLEMFHRARRAFGRIVGNIYGMTETSGPVTYLLPQDMREDTILSGGRAGKYVELAVLGDDDRPTDGTGEIGLRGPQITTGYLDRPEESAAALAGGWFHTGDIGYVDDDGFVYVVDRKKDMIKSGGFNVYPKEVEEVLYRHPDVLEAAVIGLPDARWIEAVHAVVVVREGAGTDAADLAGHCRAALARYKVPKAIHLAGALPRTPVGKFDKRALRREYGAREATAA
jgi:acyl-CoA synthetase (AMP-forming)/AMP-acid ligase II